MSSAIRLEEYRDEDEILSLASEWDDFQAQARQPTVFVQPPYLALWAKTLGTHAIPRILTGWKGERLVGYAPFMETFDRLGPLSVPALRFLGNNWGQPGDIIYADIVTSENHREVVERVLTHCRQSRNLAKWDLGFLPIHSVTFEITCRVFGFRGQLATPSKLYAHLELEGEWESFLRTRSRKFRKTLKRQHHRLQESGSLDLVVETEPEAVARRVEEMIQNHHRWWGGTSREDWFGDDRVQRYLVSAAKLLASQGQSLAAILELDGHAIAWDVGAIDGSRFFEQLISFDRTHAAASPGVVLSAMLIRRLLDMGVDRIDLGPGLDQRKQSLGVITTPYARANGYLNWMRVPARMYRSIFRRRAAG